MSLTSTDYIHSASDYNAQQYVFDAYFSTSAWVSGFSNTRIVHWDNSQYGELDIGNPSSNYVMETGSSSSSSTVTDFTTQYDLNTYYVGSTYQSATSGIAMMNYQVQANSTASFIALTSAVLEFGNNMGSAYLYVQWTRLRTIPPNKPAGWLRSRT